jgi:hypothetical protein
VVVKDRLEAVLGYCAILHQALQEGQPLLKRRPQVDLGDVLVAEQMQESQAVLEIQGTSFADHTVPEEVHFGGPYDQPPCATDWVAGNEIAAGLDLLSHIRHILLAASDVGCCGGAITEPCTEHIGVDVQGCFQAVAAHGGRCRLCCGCGLPGPPSSGSGDFFTVVQSRTMTDWPAPSVLLTPTHPPD